MVKTNSKCKYSNRWRITSPVTVFFFHQIYDTGSAIRSWDSAITPESNQDTWACRRHKVLSHPRTPKRPTIGQDFQQDTAPSKYEQPWGSSRSSFIYLIFITRGGGGVHDFTTSHYIDCAGKWPWNFLCTYRNCIPRTTFF